jgi:signal transduction histidine kinase
LTLSVRDDGKGIDEKSINTPTSLGLIGMRDRVLALGGTIEVRRLPTRGTEVLVQVPTG